MNDAIFDWFVVEHFFHQKNKHKRDTVSMTSDK